MTARRKGGILVLPDKFEKHKRVTEMKKILLIATGGTIASRKTGTGLAPGFSARSCWPGCRRSGAFAVWRPSSP